MTPEIAKRYVDHRNNNLGESWSESVKRLTPEIMVNTVRVYVSKYINGKLGSNRKQGRPSKATKSLQPFGAKITHQEHMDNINDPNKLMWLTFLYNRKMQYKELL